MKTIYITDKGKIALLEYEIKRLSRTVTMLSITSTLLGIAMMIHYFK